MATYDSLLLNFGGGIIPESQKANQYAGAAALAIGIGGTGCAALSELKAKVYQQIKPDDPKSPYPKYDHIQFLAIDSDATAIQRMRGVGKFENDEFFSIDQSNLRMAIGSPLGRKRIKEDPTLNWMEIDKLDCFFASPGTSAVRQIGRYLLISKAASLKAKIESICIRAMRGQNTPNLDVYIFAGLSGGTGSGCFLDVCYIVHNVLEQNGWAPSSHTFGFFFLPDVVTSKPEVASNAASVAYNNSNGYAAMKELDYLMNLGAANDWFEQNYGSFMVKTQAPPVDMCHLISGRRADGSMIEGAFSYAINVAADYVMTYLVEGGLPACGVLGVFALPKKFGSNRSYHVLGMCNAKIPTIQIATYLASCFYERFQNLVRYKFVKKAFLDDWVKKNKLDSDAILYSISEGTEQLILPNIDIKDLRSYGVLPKGRMVEPWAVPGNNWLDHMSGKRAQNKSALTRPLMSFRYEDAPEDSLLGRTFRRLYELSCDPSFGPYYAISMLNYAGQDLFAAIDGAIDTVREQKATAELQLHGDGKGYSLADQVVQSNERFIHKHNKRTYQEFLDTVKRYFMYVNEVNTLADTEAALQIFKQNLSNLYTVFFAPLYELLENLKETFRTNLQYLETPAATVPTADTWRILQLADIKEELDASVARLNTAEIVRNFAGFLLRGYDEWIKGDESRITKQISEFMEKTFQQQMDESLEEYLYRRFPEAGGDVNRLSQCVLDQVISTAFKNAIPMFWQDTTIFDLSNPAQSCSFNVLSVPENTAAVSNAANVYAASRINAVVQKTGIRNNISALRLASGLPFYAYGGVERLKQNYDSVRGLGIGTGLHLYARTGRGECSTEEKDWERFLPEPIPYSLNPDMTPNGEEIINLYEEGFREGIITVNSRDEYIILKSKDFEILDITRESFEEDGVMNWSHVEDLLQQYRNQWDHLHEVENCEAFLLLNDGDPFLGPMVAERVRKDHFLQYPKLQRIVRNELQKKERLRASIAALETLMAERKNSYTNQIL